MIESSDPTEPTTGIEDQRPVDGIDLLQQFRSTILAVKSVFEHSFELNQARLFIFQEVQGPLEISQSEIHQKMGLDPAIITRIVKQMEAAGQITRRPDPADNRYTLVRMTELGQHQYNEMLARVAEINELLLRGLNAEDIHALRGSLLRIQKNAEAQVTGIENGPSAKAGGPIGV